MQVSGAGVGGRLNQNYEKACTLHPEPCPLNVGLREEGMAFECNQFNAQMLVADLDDGNANPTYNCTLNLSASGEYRTFAVEEVSKNTEKPRIYRLTKLFKNVIQSYVKIRVHTNPKTKEDAVCFYERRHDKKAKIAITWGHVDGRAAPKK